MQNAKLVGRRILVVEDEAILAMDICDEIAEHGGNVIGPAASLAKGFTLFRETHPDACILNIRLWGEMVYPLADEIMQAGVPFVFASSEDRHSIPERFASIPLHAKPLALIEAAASLMVGIFR